MRIYVPFGEHWRAYCLRRLRENPAIVGYVTKSLFTFRRRRPVGRPATGTDRGATP
jgi:proline dehydrogenase